MLWIAALAAWSLVYGLSQLLLDRQLSETLLGEQPTDALSEQVTRLFTEGLG